MIALPDLIPTNWKIGAALLLADALVAVDAYRVHDADQAGFGRATTERAARDSLAVFNRVKENTPSVLSRTPSTPLSRKPKMKNLLLLFSVFMLTACESAPEPVDLPPPPNPKMPAAATAPIYPVGWYAKTSKEMRER